MSRQMTALIERVLEPLENRVEVLIAESPLAHDSSENAADIEGAQLMTLLVSFDPQPAQRWSARALAGSFITSQFLFEQLPAERELDDWLGSYLNERLPAELCVVFLLPEYSASVEEKVKKLIASLKATQHHQLGLAVAVSSTPADWINCVGIDGFILNEAKHGHSAALQVFYLLASLMAPGMLAGMDAEDLRFVCSPANQPSRLLSGVWLNDSAIFITSSDDDKLCLKTCTALAVMPMASLTMSSLKALATAVRKSASEDVHLVTTAPYGLTSEPIFASRIIPVLLMTSLADRPLP